MDTLASRGPGLLGMGPETEIKLLISVAIVGSLVLLRRLVLMVAERRVEDHSTMYRWAKISGYVAFVIGVLAVGQVWFTAIRSLGTFLGLLTAGLAIALKDLVADLAGFLFILWRKPFELGDRIELDGKAGDVVDVRIFAFTLMEIGNWVSADQSTGRMIHMPNAKVFSEPLANYTAGFPFLWNELPVLITFESDWRKAKRLLQEIADEETQGVNEEAQRTLRRIQKRFFIHYKNLTPAVYTSVLDSGVMLTIRYLCNPRRRRGTAQDLWERILDVFAEHDDVDLAYPTHRVYFNPVEGKGGARAPLPPLSGGPDAL